jgi:hypothetical protein
VVWMASAFNATTWMGATGWKRAHSTTLLDFWMPFTGPTSVCFRGVLLCWRLIVPCNAVGFCVVSHDAWRYFPSSPIMNASLVSCFVFCSMNNSFNDLYRFGVATRVPVSFLSLTLLLQKRETLKAGLKECVPTVPSR